jgi:hypothetical protein
MTRISRVVVALVAAGGVAACGGSGGGAVGPGPTGVPSPTPEPTTTTSTTTSTPSPTPSPSSGGVADDAVVVAADLPAEIGCRGSAAARVRVRNTGTATWTRSEGYKLGAVDDADPLYVGDTRVWLAEDVRVPPGAEHEFTFTLTAPGAAGTYVTDWQMVHEGVRWFGAIARAQVVVTCPERRARRGPVRLDGRSLRDDDGAFNALGATLMWAAWGYRHDRARLERALATLADGGFHYIRALGVVGHPDDPDYWDGREIDWRWPDYADVLAGLTDLAYGEYGLRVEWTLIGDGQKNIPEERDRYALVDTFLAMSRGREEAIVHFEIANEAWQNGFAGDEGIAQLRALTRYMNERTDVLVAASAPAGATCEDYARVYEGGVADLATIHFDRDTSRTDGHWRPVRQPWELQFCDGVPVGTNNEPIGPGASVASEDDPVRLVAAAIATYVSGLPAYVYHSRAGVRGDLEIDTMPGVGAYTHVAGIVPGDLASWTRKNAHWDDAPFVVYAGDGAGNLHANRMWPDLDGPTSGVVRAYGAVSGEQFFVFPMGILDRVVMAPRRACELDVVDPMTGAVVAHHTLDAGQQFELTGGAAFVLRGRTR